jgi:hypothetical protein
VQKERQLWDFLMDFLNTPASTRVRSHGICYLRLNRFPEYLVAELKLAELNKGSSAVKVRVKGEWMKKTEKAMGSAALERCDEKQRGDEAHRDLELVTTLYTT